MRLLIGGSSSKFFHLKEFGETLTKFNVEYKLVNDVEIYDGFPSRKIRKWFQSKDKFNELISDFKPDAIFVDRFTHFGIAALESKIPLFVHVRGDYWSEIKWAKETLYKDPVKRGVILMKDRIATKCFRDSTAIFPICNYLKGIVKTHYPNRPSTVLYQGIDPSRWYPAKGMELKHPCVGLIQSASIWGKTKEMFILPKILEAFPNVMFYWVGNGPYVNKILPILKKFNNFEWLGFLDYPDKIREFLTEIDVYALLSGIDMSPLTLQEAQLMKKPVIATNVGGIPELMKDNETGFLVGKGDYKTWIKKLTIFVTDEKQAKNSGISGRKFIENNFNWEKITKDFLNESNKFLNSS